MNPTNILTSISFDDTMILQNETKSFSKVHADCDMDCDCDCECDCDCDCVCDCDCNCDSGPCGLLS